MSLSAEQQAARMHRLGGSEAAAVCGLNPFVKPEDVWAVKRGLLPPFAGNEFTYWGQQIEPLILARYTEVTSFRLIQPGTLVHPTERWMSGTPDGVAVPAEAAGMIEVPPSLWLHGVEAKNVGVRQAWRWGEQCTDQVPEQHAVQACWYMAITGLNRWEFPILVGGNEFRTYYMDRNLELEGRVIERCRRFWFDNVIGGKRPEITGSDTWSELLLKWHPEPKTPDLAPAAPATDSLAKKLRDCRRSITKLEAEKAAHENALKAAIGDKTGIETAHGCVKWSATKKGGRRFSVPSKWAEEE